MKSSRTVVLIVFFAILIYAKYAYSPGPSSAVPASMQAQTVSGVPEKARQILEYVRSTGHAPEGYVGGRVFQNREGRLPSDGEYREFDVDPHDGQRNAERIIVEWNSKKAWYTGDHYQTFIPLP